MNKCIFIIFLFSFLFQSCKRQEKEPVTPDYSVVVSSIKNLTRAQVEDHFNPPVAMRNYAYACLAGYEAIAPYGGKETPSFVGLANEFNPDILPVNIPRREDIDLELVYQEAFAVVATKLVYTEAIIKEFIEARRLLLKNRLDENVYTTSVQYAIEVAEAILKYASTDFYKETRNFPEYAVQTEIRFWQPTGPDYLPATEPYWNQVRPFFLDSASEVRIPPPTPYDTSAGSKFRAELEDVMYQMNDSTPEKLWIANFWDCNPNMSHRVGHTIFFTQKMSPGGHWLHIALQACESKEFSIFRSAYITALLSMGLHDGFIACWDEKYRSNYIRPETLIKMFFDPTWVPVLQTPAFPEYPSGHSVVSASAASILEHLIEGPLAYTDSTEAVFNIPNRSYKSFREAADEAAISRVYGGIHYKPAIEQGKTMGNEVARLVLQRSKAK